MIKKKLKQLFTNWRVIILLLFLLMAIVAISPRPLQDGVAIRNVADNSPAALAGMESPQGTDQPTEREVITAINDQPVEDIADYRSLVATLDVNQTVYIKTGEATYRLRTQAETVTTTLNETEIKTFEEQYTVNETVNGTVQEVLKTRNVTREVPKTMTEVVGVAPLGLTVYDAPGSNIRKGLDLQGGTRVLLQPEYELAQDDLESLIQSMTQRLNVYGLSDISVTEAGDLSGNQYILVEIAGASEAEIQELLARQGKFEARIANETVFRGGEDITFVCRSADCAGLDPNYGCQQSGGQYTCAFRFSITTTQEAAQRQADMTRDLEVIREGQSSYLSEPLELYLDGTKVDELNIASGLRGQATTQIQITGSGTGASQEQAAYNTLQDMKGLQTVLITGSLPVDLEVVKVDAISPVLGESFVTNSLLIALLAVLAVAIVVSVRYRKAIISVPIIVTMISELIILLGVAAFIRWNIDLAAIAGIIAAIGTGVDHQIVITDETLRSGSGSGQGWKDRVKRAFSIIMMTYFTVAVAMLPLVFAGAGLLKGFAITTLIGVTLGVFVTRPAFSSMLEILLK